MNISRLGSKSMYKWEIQKESYTDLFTEFQNNQNHLTN